MLLLTMVCIAGSGLGERMSTTANAFAPAAVAVIGGTGRTGRRIADRLRTQDVEVRIGSRTAAPPFRWEKPDTWEPVLLGCTAAYIAYTPDFTHPRAVERLRSFAEHARRCRVERLVLLSGRGDNDARRSEEAVRTAGIPTAVIRSAVFAQNFSEHFFHGPVLDGLVAVPAAEVAEPFLDIDDLADVVALLLTAATPSEETLELTGPRLLTLAEAAAELSAALGRPVIYQPVTVAEFVDGALEVGVPEEEAEALGVVFEQIFDGRNAYTTDTVEKVLGRPAGDFSSYARHAAASGAWSLEPGTTVRRDVVMTGQQPRSGSGVRTGILLPAILTTGLTAGVFMDWSNAIMPGLSRVDDRTFVEAFQALDAAIVSPLFIGIGFMGSLLLIGLSAILHLRAERRAALIWIGAALLCWLLMFAITFGIHEPLNMQLRTADGLDSDADFTTARALLDEAMWTPWNTVRTLASTIASGCLIVALLLPHRAAQGAGRQTKT